MASRSTTCVAVLVAVTLAGAPGCGGGESTAPATRTAAAQPAGGYADAVARVLDPMYAAREAFAEAQGREEVRASLEALQEAYSAAARRLRAMAPPAEARDLNGRLAAVLDGLARDLDPVLQEDPVDTAQAQDVVVRTIDVERLANEAYTLP